MSGTSSSGCSPSQLLPRHRTGGIPLRVQKGSSGFSDELFCIPGRLGGEKGQVGAGESMTLRRFGGQFVCFSATDSSKVWRGRGLYFRGKCGKVYATISKWILWI